MSTTELTNMPTPAAVNEAPKIETPASVADTGALETPTNTTSLPTEPETPAEKIAYLGLNEQAWQGLLNVLAQSPYKDVAGYIAAIMSSIQPQFQPAPAPVEAEKKEGQSQEEPPSQSDNLE
jgi:hypothetical protein